MLPTTLGVISAFVGSLFAPSVFPFSQALISISVIIALWALIREALILLYHASRMGEGAYDYSFGTQPDKWHRKMGCLRLLELLTPRGRRRHLYQRLGARIDDKVVLAGCIAEPDLTEIGRGSVIGMNALLTAHSIELSDNGHQKLVLRRIRIGENCIIGAGAILLPGATVAHGVTVPAGVVITKGRTVLRSTVRGEA